MHVIEVIPLQRGHHRAALSYFSTIPYERGAVVTVPIRKKETQAVVIHCSSVSRAKNILRGASFSLKKLPAQKTITYLPQALLRTADTLSEYNAAQPGAVLFGLLPNEIKNGNVPIISQQTHTTRDRLYSNEVFQAPRDARILAYQSIVRASFARHESVVLVVPTVEDGAFIAAHMRQGIERHVHVLHSGRGIRTIRRIFSELAEKNHASLIITTPQYAFLNRADVGITIIERSRAFGYRSHSRPYLDYRHALCVYAKETQQCLISADTLIRSEDEYALRTDAAIPYEDHPKRIMLPGTLKVIPMKDTADGQTPFALFSPALLDTIQKTQAARARTFLFSARRGLSPVVACVDCGHILRCPQSGAPLSLHRTFKDGVEERWLVSSVSGMRKRATDLCSECGSWRLRERGIGIQQVYDDLIRHIPADTVFLFDHQTASTHKKATSIRDAFYATKNGVLLGTALALPYLHEPLEVSAVVNMDALRSIPSWRQQEESLGVLLALREHTNGYVFVQTRAEEDDVIRFAQSGTTEAFYTDELTAREQFMYPPFSIFIHLTWNATDQALTDTITRSLEPFTPTLYTAPAATSRIAYALLRVPRAQWPNDTLVDTLRALPPSVRIIINPDRII